MTHRLAGIAGAVRLAMMVSIFTVCFCVLSSGTAGAEEVPELLWQVPADQAGGEEAGRLENPRSVGIDPNTGNVFVSDLQNSRIDEFTVWGEFVKAWGYGVDTGASKLEQCTAASGCQQGLEGEAPGQLSTPLGLAVDSNGAVYVYDRINARVTKYGPDGEFLLMFGGNVDKTTGAEVCTAADVEAGDECGAGEAGSGPGFFENETVGNFIAVNPADTVYVGDKGRIQEFNADGTFRREIPFTGELAALAGVSPWGLAVDPVSGDIYVSTNEKEAPIYRISEAGELVDEVEDTIQVNSATKTFPYVAAGIAVDAEGNLFAVDHDASIGFNGPFEVLKFSPTGECLICGQKFAQQDNKAFGKGLMGLATSDACGIPGDDLYIPVFATFEGKSFLLSYGPAPQDVQNCPPPEVPPSITDQYAIDVGTEDAEVAARINPHFWSDTTYYLEYGPQACLDSGWTSGCSTEPLPPGEVLTSKVVNSPVATMPVVLEGLDPDTVYHYRFVAQSGGGGPVIGIGGTETTEGASSSFRTFPTPLSPQVDCTNQNFRLGASALLPDCRAYEMVSPVDKSGGDITTQKSLTSFPAELDLSSLDGDTATYSSSAVFADAVSSPYSSQYLARRDPLSGWETHAISPPREELFRPAGTAEQYELDVQYKLFSPDLSQAWLMQEADPPLDSCGVPHYINWYRRDNSSDGYEAITTKVPATKAPLEYFSEVQGASTDGTRTIFRANDKLPVDEGPEAASISGYQLYEHVAEAGTCGKTRLVSVLPANTASTLPSSAGAAAVGTKEAHWIEARESLVHNAVSDDGEVVYWTAAPEGPGQLYVRTEGTTTTKVSAGTSARFWWAASDGSFAYYTEGEKLLRYSLASKTSSQVALGVVGLVGASEDANRAYFVSNKSIGGEGTNGQPNLYVFDEGGVTFIATLSASDISKGALASAANPNPVARLAQVHADGSEIVFVASQSLTGADNLDAASGLPDREVFLYEADSDELRCLSCSFTGARPSGRTLEGAGLRVGYASRIPPWKNQFHRPRVISADGSRVFFESLERLVPRDRNKAQDVYMWTRAGDQAACEATGQELYNPAAGGCISLISSGTGTGDAEFVDSTPDASDVFFKTPESLVPQDPNRIDLYDARVGGGFPPPAAPPQCPTAASCPSTVPTPANNPPGSGSGTGNPDSSSCQALEAKSQKARSKAARLKRKAAKASGAKAAKLKHKAKKQQKLAKRLAAQARGCYSNLGGK